MTSRPMIVVDPVTVAPIEHVEVEPAHLERRADFIPDADLKCPAASVLYVQDYGNLAIVLAARDRCWLYGHADHRGINGVACTA